MKFSTSLIVALMLLFAIGCEDEIIVSPDDDDSGISLTITGLPDELAAPHGSVYNLPVTVVINRSDGTVASGVAVGMSTNSQAANINPASGNTDGSGSFKTTLNLVMPQGSSILQITASAGGISATASIQLTGTPPPQRITLNADATTLTVPTGASGIINIDATVTDSEGVGVPNVQLKVVQYPDEGEPASFGSLSKPEPTDPNGHTSFVFNSLYGVGELVIKVSTDIPGIETVIESEIPIRIVQLESEVTYFNLVADPDELVVAPGQQATSTIRAQVMDADRHGIANLRVNFDTNLGSIASSAITNQNGMVETEFITDFQYGQAIVTATIPNTELWENVEVLVRSTAASIDLSCDKRWIYADNGNTYAIVTAILRDSKNVVVPNAPITFSATCGIVTPTVITDSLGRARATFTDAGVVAERPDPALITASYPPADLTEVIDVEIRPEPQIGRINLVAAAQHMVAGNFDSTSVRATAYLEDGCPAPNGTQIHFETVLGAMAQEIVAISGNFGAAQTYYIAGSQVGVDTIRAYWYSSEYRERVYSNDVLITLMSGPPAQIGLQSDQYQLLPGGSARLTATVLDEAGNPVRSGTYVAFTATSGSVTLSSTTDQNGRATATYTAGNQAGFTEITATVTGPGGDLQATTRIRIGAGQLSRISLTADPTSIGTSGQSSGEYSMLRATIYDVSGNLVIEPTMVVFELVDQPNPPVGCDINETFPSDSVLTENGEALAVLNAGTRTGLVRVRAYTWRDSMRTDTISAYQNLTVIDGPPHQLDLDVDFEGEDVGGGSWSIEVSARVWDASHNAVEDRIPVSFTVEPEIASINPGYTGNQNHRGQSTPGVAFTNLVYHSMHTMSTVTITAQVQSPEGIIENSREIALPLQRGNLSLNVDPESWMFEEDREEAVITCWVILTDGHEVLINNAWILFTASRGRFYWFNYRMNRFEEFYPEPARKLTGLFDGENIEERGRGTVYLIAEEPDIFLDPFTLQVTVSISARVEGYEDVQAQPRYIQFMRHG